MMAGNPSWCSMSNMRSLSQGHNNNSSTFLRNCPSLLAQYHEGFDHHRSSSSSSNLSLNSTFANDDDDQEQLPHSWSQLLFCGFANEEDKLVSNYFLHTKRAENLEDQSADHIKLENSETSQIHFTCNGDVGSDREFINYNQNTCEATNWSRQQVIMPVSSPKSSVTSLGRNLFDFPSNKGSDGRIQMSERSYKSNTTSNGGVFKKTKVQSSPTQPPLKVRKEKLGERITALHQIVSPFGKTDTASVLLEAIACIRFLQGKIEALSSPYLCNTSSTMSHQLHGNQDENKKDLKSRGLCLVPLSCTHHIGNDHGADYWAPQPGGGF